MRFFGLKSCDTCRKAQKQIIATNQPLTVIDVRADGVSNADLTQIITQFGDKAINRASTTWRGLSDAEKKGDPATLLSVNPTLMKRPVIEKNGVWTIGWKPDVAAQVLDI
jgi:arsenate reductase-like glutaredoxin family protein